MKKRLATGYTFDASAQTIVHADFSDMGLAGIQLITNVTDNVVIYQFNDASKGGSLSTDTLTLDFDTTSMSDTDQLMILVEDGSPAVEVDTGLTQPTTPSDTQPVSTASLPLPTGAATAANQQTDALTDTELRATPVVVDLGANNDVTVTTLPSIPAGNNNIGDVDVASLPVAFNTGTRSSTTQRVTIATDDVVPVSDNGGSLTVDGTVTANAGTNLNTSALALESGGNLAAQTTALQIMDDWDESDRAKVNIIVGQAGVQGGSGAVSATTQRVVLATDVALPAGTNAIGKLAANSGVDIGDVDVASIAAGTNNIGQVSVAPQTANGLSVFNATSSDGATALTNTAQVIKASAGQVYGWYIYNPNSSAQFVQFYNVAAASVTVGTTNPLFMLTIPATSAANVEFTNGITFSNAGFSCAATSTAGGNGAPTTALDAVVFFK